MITQSIALETIIPVLDGVIVARTGELLAYGTFRGVNLKPSPDKPGFVLCDGVPYPMGIGYVVNTVGSLSERMSAIDKLTNPEARKLVTAAAAARRNSTVPISSIRPSGYRVGITSLVEDDSKPTDAASPAGRYRVWAPRLED